MSNKLKVSVPESRSFRFPKSRSKYLDDAVKLAKTLPGFEKSKKHYKVTFSKTDSGSDDLWELLKIASRWKGAVFLFDGKEVDQDVWESSFQQRSVESGDQGEKAAVAEKPEKSEQPPKVEAPPVVVEETPEKAPETPKVEEKKPEKAPEPPTVEEKKPEKAPEPPKAEEKEPVKAEEPPAAQEKEPVKAEEPPKTEEKKPAAKPVSVQINPAPKPQENSGCGKSAAMFAIAALGLLQFFR